MIQLTELPPALATGIVFGTAGGLSPGPTLTLVVLQTLRYGAREGFKVAIAPLLTDLPIVAVSVLLVRHVDSKPVLGVLTLCGAAFLAWLARESLRAAPLRLEAVGEARPGSIRKGFLANLLNPHPFVFWLTVGGPTTVEAWRTGPVVAGAFIVGLYGCLVGAKLLVALLVARGRRRLEGGYVWTLRALGLLLAVFAIRYLVVGLRYLDVV